MASGRLCCVWRQAGGGVRERSHRPVDAGPGARVRSVGRPPGRVCGAVRRCPGVLWRVRLGVRRGTWGRKAEFCAAAAVSERGCEGAAGGVGGVC